MPPLTLLVLYVADLEQSRRFYTDLGLSLTKEQYRDSPVHYATVLDGDVILKLWPAGDGPPTRTRLGLALPDPGDIAEYVGAAPHRVRSSPGMLLTATDPDGNVIEMTLAEDW